jgi:hypothetical protein
MAVMGSGTNEAQISSPPRMRSTHLSQGANGRDELSVFKQMLVGGAN